MYHLNEKIVTFVDPTEIETEAIEQIKNTASMPFVFKHVAVMPDVHYGKGSTVGTVLPTIGAIIPAAVGVDIGCGMIAVKTNLNIKALGDLSDIRHSIERSIPMSAGKFNTEITESAQRRITLLEDYLWTTDADGERGSELIDLDQKFGTKSWRHQLGTLGGGNHFIEICLDETDAVWITLHSGSRGIGNKIGNYYINEAQKLCESMYIKLPDKDLAYLPIEHPTCQEYLCWLNWAQTFAKHNRDEMMDRVLKDISHAIFREDGHQKDFEIERINCHHNFTQMENHFNHNIWITRKGAIQAKEGMKGLIPGSMGTNSYIVSGKENKMSFHSAPHGAGRRMSRAKAKAQFTIKDFDEAMKNIEHRRSDVLIDELPMAYKDIFHVITNAQDLINVEHTLHQVLNVKGD